MQSKLLIVLAALSGALGSGFTIPRDQPDGTYMVDAASGKHTKVGEIPTRDMVDVMNTVKPRQPWSSLWGFNDGTTLETTCGSGNVDPNDLAGAISALAAACGTGNLVPAGKYVYTQSGGAVAYVCNQGGDNACNEDEVNAAMSDIGLYCENYQVGWGEIGDWKKSYGYDLASSNFCR